MSYSISEIAKMLNVSAYTIRYYDKEGLFPLVKRVNGIRVFEDKDFPWPRHRNATRIRHNGCPRFVWSIIRWKKCLGHGKGGPQESNQTQNPNFRIAKCPAVWSQGPQRDLFLGHLTLFAKLSDKWCKRIRIHWQRLQQIHFNMGNVVAHYSKSIAIWIDDFLSIPSVNTIIFPLKVYSIAWDCLVLDET